ncbi:MAG: hypothetical protein WC787_00530 [Patescibacteria group bacterium]|jgi:HD superfamily phosphohydrolase YqeK
MKLDDVAYGSAVDSETETFDLPYADLRYRVAEPDGLCAQTIRAFGLERLRGIKQLPYIHTAVPTRMFTRPHVSPTFTHTRWQHSHDVMAIAKQIGHAVGLDDAQMTHLTVAALSHDVCTVAGGDVIKDIDPSAFDEDAAYPRALVGDAWEDLRQRYALEPESLTEIINNRGMLGQLLDWADKIGYVARDVGEYRGFCGISSPLTLNDACSINASLQIRPMVCEVWKTLVLKDGQIVSNDPLMLADFLRLRVLLFRDLYYGRHTQFLRTLVRCIVECLLRREHILPADLFRWDDAKLESRILQHAGIRCARFQIPHMGYPEVLEYQNENDANAFASSLHRSGTVFTAACRKRLLKPRMDLPVLSEGTVLPFEDACPTEAARIRELAEEEPPVLLFILRDPQLNPAFLQDYERYRESCEPFSVFPSP